MPDGFSFEEALQPAQPEGFSFEEAQTPAPGADDWDMPSSAGGDTAAPAAPQSQAVSIENAALQGATRGTGAVISGLGKQGEAAAIRLTQRQLNAIRAIDQGQSVDDQDDPLGYQYLSPEDRAKARGDIYGAHMDQEQFEPNLLERTGKSIKDQAGTSFPVDPANEGRSTRVAGMVGNLVPALGATALGTLAGGPVGGALATAAVVGGQAYDDTYDDARANGASHEEADRAAGQNAIAQIATTVAPIGRLLPLVPVPLRPGLTKTFVNLGQRGVEMSGGNALGQFAQNYIAQQTYDPNRSVFKGTGDAGIDGFLAGLIVHSVPTLAHRPDSVAVADRVMRAGSIDEAIGAANQAANEGGAAGGGPAGGGRGAQLSWSDLYGHRPDSDFSPVLTTPGGLELPYRYDVVNASDLKRSSTTSPAGQVADIAQGLDAERLHSSQGPDIGAPVVDARGNIVAGNVRTEAIRQAYASGNASAYRAMLGRYGFDVDGMPEPVLVRRLNEAVTPEQARQMALESNAPANDLQGRQNGFWDESRAMETDHPYLPGVRVLDPTADRAQYFAVRAAASGSLGPEQMQAIAWAVQNNRPDIIETIRDTALSYGRDGKAHVQAADAALAQLEQGPAGQTAGQPTAVEPPAQPAPAEPARQMLGHKAPERQPTAPAEGEAAMGEGETDPALGWRKLGADEPVEPGMEVATDRDGQQYVRKAAEELPEEHYDEEPDVLSPHAVGAQVTTGALPVKTRGQRLRDLRTDVEQSAEDRAQPHTDPVTGAVGLQDHEAYVPGIPGRMLADREFSPRNSGDHKFFYGNDPVYRADSDAVDRARNLGMVDEVRKLQQDDIALEKAHEFRNEANPRKMGVFENQQEVPEHAQALVDKIDDMLNSDEGKEPAVQTVLNRVRAALHDREGNIETLPSRIYGARRVLTNLLELGVRGTTELGAAAKTARKELTSLIEPEDGIGFNETITAGAPLFRGFLGEWSKRSLSINQMEYLQGRKFTGVDGYLQLNLLNATLKDIYDQQKAVGNKKAKALTDAQIQALKAVRNELAARSLRDRMGRMPGSDTTQQVATAARWGAGKLGMAIKLAAEGGAHALSLATTGGYGNAALIGTRLLYERRARQAAEKAAAEHEARIATRKRELLGQGPSLPAPPLVP